MSYVSAWAPGRTELAGNHTDHQGGRAIAATVSCGVRVELRANAEGDARLESAGFVSVDIPLDDLAPVEEERNTTAALVRGVVAGLRENGVPIEGFDARVESDVPAGGGLSSSAAFELALIMGLIRLFGEGSPSCEPMCAASPHAVGVGAPAASPHVAGAGAPAASPRAAGGAASSASPHAVGVGAPAASPHVAGAGAPAAQKNVFSSRSDSYAVALGLARIGQRAECDYFGKPCGLMDQAAVACGGVNLFDFSQESPSIERIDFDFSTCGHVLCLVDTHCDHSLHTREYAQVALDMKAVARAMGARMLSEVPCEAFLERLGDIRAELGDLPALRGLHYYHEMHLVDVRAEALRKGDFPAFLAATRQSGASSAQYLQNVSTHDSESQPAMVALALADALLEGEGAVRIHGGGFGGTVQAFVPANRLRYFARVIDARLGEGSCRVCEIVREGAHAE